MFFQELLGIKDYLLSALQEGGTLDCSPLLRMGPTLCMRALACARAHAHACKVRGSVSKTQLLMQ